MKQIAKRFVPLLMALTMLAAALITPILAEEEDTVTENLFKVAAPGEPNPSGLTHAMRSSSEFYTSSPIAVEEGDVLYFGPCDPDQGYYMTIYSPEGKSRSGRVLKSNSETHATLNDGKLILKYTVPAQIGYVCMITPNALCRATVVTKNAPFGEQAYRNYLAEFDADATTPIHRNSVLRGKNALFIGDSINAGSYDVLAPSTGRAFAGRIALSTGLRVTNKSVGGATLIKRSDKSWIVDQLNSQKGQKFDIIVVFGGVNDARHNIVAGEFVENEAALTKVNTYAAGLQYLLLTAKQNHPNAEIFYVAGFPLPGHDVGYAADMSAYVTVAGEICENYDINLIDLYNNAELTEKLQPHTVRYLPDLLHPTSEGYDLITPYIQAELERVMGGTPMNETTAATTHATDSTLDTAATVSTTAATTAATTGALNEPKESGCGATALGTVTAILTLCGACAWAFKKKE